MKFTEEFRALGYELLSPRTDWSAESRSGVCLSIWSKETRRSPDSMAFDTRVDASPIELWGHKPGNKRRIRHLERVLAEFGGAIDVVMVTGTPGGSYETATPWVPKERRGAKWSITFFDHKTGHFSAEARA